MFFVLIDWVWNWCFAKGFHIWIVYSLYRLRMHNALLRIKLIYIRLILKEMINSLDNPLRWLNILIRSLINFHLPLTALKIKWRLNTLIYNIWVVFYLVLLKQRLIHALIHLIGLKSRHCTSSLNIVLLLLV